MHVPKRPQSLPNHRLPRYDTRWSLVIRMYSTVGPPLFVPVVPVLRTPPCLDVLPPPLGARIDARIIYCVLLSSSTSNLSWFAPKNLSYLTIHSYPPELLFPWSLSPLGKIDRSTEKANHTSVSAAGRMCLPDTVGFWSLWRGVDGVAEDHSRRYAVGPC